MSSYKPLRRDRSKELDRLAKRIAKLVNSGVDPILCDDVYNRLAKSWERVPPTAIEDLEAMQSAILDRMSTGAEQPDDLMRIYEFHADQLQRDYQRALAVKDAEVAHGPRRGQKVAALGAGVVAGHFGYRMAERMIGDLLRPVGTLMRLFK